MRHVQGLLTLGALGLFVCAGCQPAGRYGNQRTGPVRLSVGPQTSQPGSNPGDSKVGGAPLPADYVWMEPRASEKEPAVDIVFVHPGSDRAEWERLKDFWNDPQPSPEQIAAAFAGSPWSIGPLVGPPPQRTIKIKVPLGLDDPTSYVPTANPPTLGKWDLGKRLFFDKEIFLQPASAEVKQSCASCHDPARGFTDGRVAPPGGTLNTPTLLNSVYNANQFWDGRATALEEIVQRSLDDERDAPNVSPMLRHSWNGVVARLRERPEYVQRFMKVFGTPPTQDAVGKALATYMRTLLSGNSLHDRAVKAMKERNGTTLEARDYEKVLDDAALKRVSEPEEPLAKAEAAKQLQQGAALFVSAKCVSCHGGSSYSDSGFHNLGVGDLSRRPEPGKETGRFAVVAPGLKDRRQIGAYKTPTLRALPRTGPFFHDGTRDKLFDVVAWHVGKAPPSSYLDPEIRDLGLKEPDVRALTAFLKALDGDPVPDVIAK